MTAERDAALGKAAAMEQWSVETEMENVRLRTASKGAAP